MTTVAILPVSDANGERRYRAIALGARYANAGDKQSTALPPEQQAELDSLVEAELKAATARTAAALRDSEARINRAIASPTQCAQFHATIPNRHQVIEPHEVQLD